MKFEMSNFGKFFYKYMFIIGQGFSGLLFIFLIVNSIKSKYDLKGSLEGALIICGFISGLFLVAWWRIKKARIASELTIDIGKKEFRAFIYDIKKEVRFGADDIIEVGNRANGLRFFLKDGTGVTWDKYGTDKQLLEDTIKSFGISINNKRIW